MEEQRVLIQVSVWGWGGGRSLHNGGTEGSDPGQCWRVGGVGVGPFTVEEQRVLIQVSVGGWVGWG